MEHNVNYQQLFVGGDLSGIQKFLYNISSRKAAVSLKGRSFYLSQYMRNVCTEIESCAKKAGAKNVRTIYCSGGKLYMIIDNTDAIVRAIDECAAILKKRLWEKHYGQLGLNISHVAFTENEGGTVQLDGHDHARPGVLWQIVNKGFARQKSRKFEEVITADYNSFFEPIAVGGLQKVCVITGIESSECVEFSFHDDEGETAFVLPSVKEQMQLGEELNKQDHSKKSFEDYADKSYLGVLRMDVDGLGARFSNGFDSISDYEAFSGRLTDFFEKKVKAIQQEDAFRDYLNIIYAGGDDLFIVGEWEKTIEIATRIHSELTKNFRADGISISGGMVAVKPKFPIAKSAEQAGLAEEAAKHFNGGKKNAFHFLGRTVSWNGEFEYVSKIRNQLVELIVHNNLSKGILHKLMLYASIADANKLRKQKGIPEDFSYVWHAAYYLTRYMERYKNNPAVYDFCRNLRDKELSLNQVRNLELIALAARWAELHLRN